MCEKCLNYKTFFASKRRLKDVTILDFVLFGLILYILPQELKALSIYLLLKAEKIKPFLRNYILCCFYNESVVLVSINVDCTSWLLINFTDKT